jgi:hypothetical protein
LRQLTFKATHFQGNSLSRQFAFEATCFYISIEIDYSINSVYTYFSVIATASSVHKNKVERWGPMYAIDGLVPSGSSNFFHSDLEDHPWFQLDLIGATVVKGVTITNRKNCCGDRFQNVSINVGDEPAVPGDLVTNPKCAIFEGPSATGRIERIMCTEPLVGRYLQVQLRGSSPSILQINEIEVIKPTTTDTATGNFL